ncbi:DUF2971 domain-containing protein [Luteolibacter luteus]|uniref:DUF2971 domain-containing protein n=1 Tax=Luteolibacter luteus TaxID=2728835 RepID=A0A858RNB0_9BACT|nr:DUF2971 domain-containing protein [Luteolibacter luteus]QJE97994.1 DUF2971 domain-containing protein [Luteolibacter luteus]
MILWRYLSTEFAFQALETGQWKLGRIQELNDPLDCWPVVLPAREGKKGTGMDPELLLKCYTEDWGIICYTESIHDPAVWAHYGDCHRGVAFGFDFPEEVAPLKVNYVEKRPFFYADQLMGGHISKEADRRAQLIRDGFLHKAPGWSFEKEHRHFVSFMDPSVEFRRPHYFTSVPKQYLKHIAIGIRSQATNIDFTKFFGLSRPESTPLLRSVGRVRIDQEYNRVLFNLE